MQRTRILISLALAAAVFSTMTAAVAIDRSASPAGGRRAITAAVAQGDAFSYQGRLTESGGPANGTYDLQFILYDASSGGAQVGATITKDNVNVAAGVFTVDLDFGSAVFNGDARWLEIGVRPGTSAGTFTVLSPRQPILNAPYAIHAKSADAAESIAVPFVASGSSNAATAVPTSTATVTGTPTATPTPTGPQGLVDITQTGTGIGIASHRTNTGSTAQPAIYGVNAGGGAGVQGETTNAAGTGGAFLGAGVSSTALEARNGALRIGNPADAAKPAYVHTVDTTGGDLNTCATGTAGNKATVLTNALATSTSLLFITPVGAASDSFAGIEAGFILVFSPAAAVCPEGSGKWVIFQAGGTPVVLVEGMKFNVLVISQ